VVEMFWDNYMRPRKAFLGQAPSDLSGSSAGERRAYPRGVASGDANTSRFLFYKKNHPGKGG